MSCKACATSCTKQLNLLNDAICAFLDYLPGDPYGHRSCVEGRCQPEIVQIAERARKAEPPGLDAAVFLDVRSGFQQRAVEIEIGCQHQQPVGDVRCQRWNDLAVHHLDSVGGGRRRRELDLIAEDSKI